MKKWQYLVKELHIPLIGTDGKPVDDAQPQPIEDQLNAIGDDGWEMVKYDVVMLPPAGRPLAGVQPRPRPCLHCMFKREKPNPLHGA